jgi:hypothetical protein
VALVALNIEKNLSPLSNIARGEGKLPVLRHAVLFAMRSRVMLGLALACDRRREQQT